VRFVRCGTDRPEVSYAIGRWVGGAVVRNRVRRRLRAAVVRHEDALVTGGHYLLSADATAATLPFAELEASVGALLARAADDGSRA
jgi:ribonuclease P protein component